MDNKEKKSWKRFILPSFIILLAIGGSIYGINSWLYSRSHETTDNAQLEGNINPIIPKVAGYISALRVEENQPVKKGDTLFLIDDRDLRNKVEQAQAALNNALSSLDVMRSNVYSADANEHIYASNIDAANAAVKSAEVRIWKANQDYDRYKNLLAENATTQHQFDAAKAEKDAAEAQMVLLQKQYNTAVKQTQASQSQTISVEKNIGVAQSVIEQRKADLDFAKLQLSYTVVTAPTDGVISKKSLQVGQFVSAGQMLFSIVSNDQLWVVANFKETQLSKMKVGQEVAIEVDAFEGKTLKGKISSFSRATGAKFSLLPPDNATGNFVKVVQRVPVKIEFAEIPTIERQLSAGMSVKVAVSLEDQKATSKEQTAKLHKPAAEDVTAE
jgi:membrane fusion protein (multidrug efflux system)